MTEPVTVTTTTRCGVTVKAFANGEPMFLLPDKEVYAGFLPHEYMAEAGCPIPEECADYTQSLLERQLEDIGELPRP